LSRHRHRHRHRHRQQTFRAVHTWLAPVLRDGPQDPTAVRPCLATMAGLPCVPPGGRNPHSGPPCPRPANIPGQLAIVRIATPGRPTRGQGKHGARGSHAPGAKAERDGSFGEGRSWSHRNRGNLTTKDCPDEQHTVDRPGDRDCESSWAGARSRSCTPRTNMAIATAMNRTISPRSMILRVGAPDTA
jgi:hypothetical protein